MPPSDAVEELTRESNSAFRGPDTPAPYSLAHSARSFVDVQGTEPGEQLLPSKHAEAQPGRDSVAARKADPRRPRWQCPRHTKFRHAHPVPTSPGRVLSSRHTQSRFHRRP